MPRVAASRRNPQFNYLLFLAQGRPVFTADYYAVDGISGKVASFIDWNDVSHILAQATGGLQVAIPSADSAAGNKLRAIFAGGQYYASNRSNAYWGYTADGTGFEAIGLVKPSTVAVSHTFFATVHVGNTQGYQAYLSSTNLSMNSFKAGAATISSFNYFTAVSAGSLYVLDVFHSVAGTTQRGGQGNASAVIGGTYASTPEAGATAYPLTLGATGLGSTPLQASFFFLSLIDSASNTAWRLGCKAYLVSNYGATA